MRRISIVLASRGTILTPLEILLALQRWKSAQQKGYTYAALQRSPIDVVPRKLADSHRSILMGIHLNKGKSSVSLEPSLDNITEVLEQRNKIILSSVGREIADVNSCLPLRGLLDNHIVTLDTMSREMVMAIRSSRGHSHSSHRRLLRDRGLALLVGPVATDCTGTKPFTIHATQGLFGIRALAEGNESIAAGAACLHIPHNAGFGNGPKGRESLRQNLVIDLVRKITDEDVEVVSSILFAGLVGLISPVDTDFLSSWLGRYSQFQKDSDPYSLMNSSAVQSRHRTLSRTWIIIFNETIVVPLTLSRHS